MDIADFVERTFRTEHGRVLGALIAALGDFDLAEDALQEALITALERWPAEGVPRSPAAWMVTVARRKAIDRLRRDQTLARKQAGLLAAQVDEKTIERIWDLLESAPGTTISVDLESRTLRAGEGEDAIEDSFQIDDYTRWRLLEGLDDIGITLSHEDAIDAYEADRLAFKPATL